MNRNTLLLVLFIPFMNFYGYSQHSITPGNGFKEIQLEMAVDELIKIIGEPTSIVSRENEEEKWQENGYDIKKEFSFVLAFDSVYTFENDNKYAIWKAYVKNNRIIFLNLSSYVYDRPITKNIQVLANIHFYDNPTKIKNSMGANFYTIVDKSQNTEYLYLDAGISFSFYEDELRNIFLYQPITSKRKKEIVRRLKLKNK